MSADVLPNCLARESRDEIILNGVLCVSVFCGNCGKDSRHVIPKADKTFAFYLCDPCLEKHGAPAGTIAVPDELYFAALAETQLEQYGRFLDHGEIAEVVKDGNSTIAKLAKDRHTRKFGG